MLLVLPGNGTQWFDPKLHPVGWGNIWPLNTSSEATAVLLRQIDGSTNNYFVRTSLSAWIRAVIDPLIRKKEKKT